MLMIFEANEAERLRVVDFARDQWAKGLENLTQVLGGVGVVGEVLDKNIVKEVLRSLSSLAHWREHRHFELGSDLTGDFLPVHLKSLNQITYNLTGSLGSLFGGELNEAEATTGVVILDGHTTAHNLAKDFEVVVEVLVAPGRWYVLHKNV